MRNRIKEIRQDNNLTQQEFADRLGIKRGTIANYELGRNEPIDAVVTLICEKFNVNEDWLRYGKEPKEKTTSREEEITAIVASALNGNSDFKKAVIQAICSRTDKELEALENLLRNIYENLPKNEKGQDES